MNDLTSWKACGVFRQAYGNLQEANSQITQVVNQADFTKTLAGSKDLDTALTDIGVDMARVTQGKRHHGVGLEMDENQSDRSYRG